jgi:ABC-type nitrate/sulfonate/bicarbonate transport system substrate-binding protein
LRAFPAHPDERRRLAALYVKGGQYLNARQHLDMLVEAAGGEAKADPELLALAAECDWALDKKADAVRLLDRAVGSGKAPVATFKRAIELNYEQTRQSTGDARAESNIQNYLTELAPVASREG